MNEKDAELLKDREFLGKILKMDSEEEIIDAFKKRGVELTHEELIGLRGSIEDMLGKIEELGESEIEKISGGVTVEALLLLGASIIHAGEKLVGGYQRVKESEKQLKESRQRAYEAEKRCNQILISTGAVVIVAGALCYFKKEISRWWRKKSYNCIV